MPEIDDFLESCLDAHNKLRTEHQGKPLSWNADLASSAEDWATRLAARGYVQHSESYRFGENILMTDEDEDVSGSEVVERWAEEERLYDYTNPKWQKGTSHFTQMIWRSTTDIGVAKVKLDDGRSVVVVHYRPPGNMNKPGDYATNVVSSSPSGPVNGQVNGTTDSDREESEEV